MTIQVQVCEINGKHANEFVVGLLINVMNSTNCKTDTDYLSHSFFLDSTAVSFGYQVP